MNKWSTNFKVLLCLIEILVFGSSCHSLQKRDSIIPYEGHEVLVFEYDSSGADTIRLNGFKPYKSSGTTKNVLDAEFNLHSESFSMFSFAFYEYRTSKNEILLGTNLIFSGVDSRIYFQSESQLDTIKSHSILGYNDVKIVHNLYKDKEIPYIYWSIKHGLIGFVVNQENIMVTRRLLIE